MDNIVENIIKNGQKLKNQLIFNFAWFIVSFLIGMIYFYSPLATSIAHPFTRWYQYLPAIYGPFLIIQSILHSFVLHRFFPGDRRRNIFWIVLMNFLILAAYLIELYVAFFYSGSSLR